jgi:putative tricarboxylic transport membrane protein
MTADILLAGLYDAFQPAAILYVVLGLLVGYAVGVLPGLSRSTAVALAIPITFYMGPLLAISFLIGIGKGGASGGAITAILVNTPGEPSSAATCLDGFPMARQGKGEKALKIAMIGSVFGDFIATLILVVVAYPIAKFALKIGPVELTAMLLFAVTFVAGLSGRSLLKGLVSAALGVLLACIGLDVETGTRRLTFGSINLNDGIPVLAVAIGVLALAEMILQIQQRNPEDIGRSFVPTSKNPEDRNLTFKEFMGLVPTFLRSALIGTGVGCLPGLGAAVASFLSYGAAQRASKQKHLFGKGAPEGVAAAETADNAVVPASLIPLFTIGIPGNVSAALLIGAFMIHGITPGPLMFEQHPQLIAGLYATMLMASVLMFVIGWYGLRVFIQLTRLPEAVVIASVVFLCVIGAYLEEAEFFTVYLMIALAVLGYLLRMFDYPYVTFLIGFIITPNLELALRQSLLLTNREPAALLEHPIALVFLAAAAISAWLFVKNSRTKIIEE